MLMSSGGNKVMCHDMFNDHSTFHAEYMYARTCRRSTIRVIVELNLPPYYISGEIIAPCHVFLER